jgi:hypothetical protein
VVGLGAHALGAGQAEAGEGVVVGRVGHGGRSLADAAAGRQPEIAMS